MLTHARDLLKGSRRYARGLRGFLATTLELEEAKEILKRQLERREDTFLQVMERGIFENARSPYRKLLLHAGLQFEDVKALVNDRGLDNALRRLHESGVYVTLDEFKGRSPVRRPGLEFPVTAFDFDNPLLAAYYSGSTGGSRSGGTRVEIDFDHIAHEAAGTLVNLHAIGTQDHPGVLVRAGPPSTTGLRSMFLQTRAGHAPVKWFSPNQPGWNRQGLQGRALLEYTLLVSRLIGRRLPRPQYAPNWDPIVDYLAAAVERRAPAQVICGASDWVRICLAAESMGADIGGTVFRGGGEPYTEGKAAVLHRMGARGSVSYAMHEAGNLGQGCGNPQAPDDVHFVSDRLALLQRPVEVTSGITVNALSITTLATNSPKVMLNVESGDYADVDERDCGCLWQDLGFTTHLQHIRSYEKLTSGGVMFMGSMLHQLLEETLPDRFGGSPLDYQLVEEEEEGVPWVSVLVSPRIGPLDEDAVIETIIESLSFADWSRRQADLWRRNGTLRVQRREPYLTRAGKILPLHVKVAT